MPVIDTLKGLKKSKMAIAGLVIISLFILVAVFAPFIAPHDPLEQNITQRLSPPSIEYPFGTDDFGRCVLSRVIYGTRVSLLIAIAIVTITTAVGTVLGMISGYYGGVIDEVIMRSVDFNIAFPGLILAIVLASILGPGFLSLIIALSVTGWIGYARVIRGSVLSVKEKEFVEAAKAIGLGDLCIMFRHILPNVIAPVMALAVLTMGITILIVSGFSFLGLGAQPPTPEWGYMLNEGRSFMRTAPHLMIFPGSAIIMTVLGFNLLGDALRDAMDPRLKRVKIE